MDYGNAVVSMLMQTVVETPAYLADAERLFSSDEREAIVDRLAADPTCGVVIPASGGPSQGAVRIRLTREKWRRANYLPIQWNESADFCSDGFRRRTRRRTSRPPNAMH